MKFERQASGATGAGAPSGAGRLRAAARASRSRAALRARASGSVSGKPVAISRQVPVAMVEGDDRGVEADREVVGEAGPPGRRRHPLQARAEIVGEIADRPALERRQVGIGLDPVGRQHRPQGLEGRARHRRAVPGRPAVPGAKGPERRGGEVGVAPERVVPHRAVEEGQPAEAGPAQAGGRIGGIERGKRAAPHGAVIAEAGGRAEAVRRSEGPPRDARPPLC